MTYRGPAAAPESSIPPDRRGRVLGRYCLACASVYRQHARLHRGKPVHGKDHVASPCSHEGDVFAPGEPWWEPAVEVLPPPPPPAPAPAPVAAV